MYIYVIQNLINYKIYVGKSKKINNKENYFGSGVVINKAIKKYGKENFHKSILISSITSEIKLNILEKFYIKLFNSQDRLIGYNIADGGDGGNTGGMKEETKIRKSKIKENGLSEFQEIGIKAYQTSIKNETNILRVQKTKNSMLKENDEGLNKYQVCGKKTSLFWNSLTTEEKSYRNNKISETWKNKSEEEIKEFKKMRSLKAKEQRKNETKEMKKYRSEICKQTFAKGVSSFNLKTKIYKRVTVEEFKTNVFVAGIGTDFITKVTTNTNDILYLFNPNSYIKFSKDFKCGEKWVKGLSSDGLKYSTPYKKFKHLEGIIRERIFLGDITEDIIINMSKTNYI